MFGLNRIHRNTISSHTIQIPTDNIRFAVKFGDDNSNGTLVKNKELTKIKINSTNFDMQQKSGCFAIAL